MENGLPLVSFALTYRNQIIEMNNELFDTGCAATIFDTDLLSKIGLELDLIEVTAKRMYGVGGSSELCYEQTVSEIKIDSFFLPSFKL